MSNRMMTSQASTAQDPSVVLHQQLMNLQQLLQLQQLQPAAVCSIPEPQVSSVAPVVQQLPSLQQTAEIARPSISSPGFQNLSSGPVPVAAAMVMTDGLYSAQTQPHHLYSEPVVQKHPYHSSSPAGQPGSGLNSWRDGSGVHQNSYPRVGHQAANFNNSYDGQMWDGSTRAGSGRYPDSSQGRNFPESAPNTTVRAYRTERLVQRDSPGYWDPNRHGERWKRDRRY